MACKSVQAFSLSTALVAALRTAQSDVSRYRRLRLHQPTAVLPTPPEPAPKPDHHGLVLADYEELQRLVESTAMGDALILAAWFDPVHKYEARKFCRVARKRNRRVLSQYNRKLSAYNSQVARASGKTNPIPSMSSFVEALLWFAVENAKDAPVVKSGAGSRRNARKVA